MIMRVGDIIKAPPHKHGNKRENNRSVSNYGIVSHFKPSATNKHVLHMVMAYQDEEGSVRDLQYTYHPPNFKILKKGQRTIQEENNLFGKIWDVGAEIVFVTDDDDNEDKGWKKGTIISVDEEEKEDETLNIIRVQAYDGNIKRKKRKRVMKASSSKMKIARWMGSLDSLLDGAVEARIMGEEMEWEEDLNAGVMSCHHGGCNTSSSDEKEVLEI